MKKILNNKELKDLFNLIFGKLTIKVSPKDFVGFPEIIKEKRKIK